jgi:hypothetical protein
VLACVCDERSSDGRKELLSLPKEIITAAMVQVYSCREHTLVRTDRDADLICVNKTRLAIIITLYNSKVNCHQFSALSCWGRMLL